MEFTPKELDILYMHLYRSIYAYVLEYSMEDETQFDDEYKEKLVLMRKIGNPNSTLWEGRLLELMTKSD